MEEKCGTREQRIEMIEKHTESMQKSIDKLFYALMVIVAELAVSGVGILNV